MKNLVIDHPTIFKSGRRVLTLMSRTKDGNEENRIISEKTSSNEKEFDKTLRGLLLLKKTNQRIYSSLRGEYLLDIDYDDWIPSGKDHEDSVFNEIQRKNLTIIYSYPTKNGKHIILEPFDLLGFGYTREIWKKEAMILWAY